MSKAQLQQALIQRLNLTSPEFHLEKTGAKVSGSVVSTSFSGKTDQARQQMIWDALDNEFGSESIHLIGTLLAYTPEEWNIDLMAQATNVARTKVTLR